MQIITSDNSQLVYDEINNSYEYNDNIIIPDELEIYIDRPKDTTLFINGCISAASFKCNCYVEVAGNINLTDGDLVVPNGISVARSLIVDNGNVYCEKKLMAIDKILVNGSIFLYSSGSISNCHTFLWSSSLNTLSGIKILEKQRKVAN